MTQPPPYEPQASYPPSYPPPPASGGPGTDPSYPGGGYGGAPAPYGGPGARPQANSLALAAMIVGIACLVLMWVPFVGWLALPGAVVGLVLGIVAIRRAPVAGGRGQALAGIICSAVALVLFVLTFVVAGALIASDF